MYGSFLDIQKKVIKMDICMDFVQIDIYDRIWTKFIYYIYTQFYMDFFLEKLTNLFAIKLHINLVLH